MHMHVLPPLKCMELILLITNINRVLSPTTQLYTHKINLLYDIVTNAHDDNQLT